MMGLQELHWAFTVGKCLISHQKPWVKCSRQPSPCRAVVGFPEPAPPVVFIQHLVNRTQLEIQGVSHSDSLCFNIFETWHSSMQMMGRVSGEERLQSRRISLTCNHVSSEVNEIGTIFECFKAIQVPQDLRTYQCTSLEARNSTEQMTSCGCFCNSAMNSPGSNCRK